MLRYSDRAEAQLLAIHSAGGPHYLKLVRRLIELENDASTFEALRNPIVLDTAVELPAGAGPARAHVMEAEPGWVFVIVYRLADDAEDVWILELRHGQ